MPAEVLAPSSVQTGTRQGSEHRQCVWVEGSLSLWYAGGCFCPCPEDIPLLKLHSTCCPLCGGGAEKLGRWSTHLDLLLVQEPVSPRALLAAVCPSECAARAATRPVCQGTQQESVASGLSFCTCFANGVLEIQLSCQPNDTVLPFCELRCADRSLLLSARIYFFSQTHRLFYKAITYHLNTYRCSTVFLQYFLL